MKLKNEVKHMKQSRRILSLLLLAAMSLTVSCGSDSTITDDTTITTTTPETVETGRIAELGKRDFGGETYVIYDANHYPEMHINIPEEEQNGDIVNDALYNRDTFVEETYNIKLDYIQVTLGGNKELRASVQAGDDLCNLFIGTGVGGVLNTLASEGILANLCDMDYLSLDQKWWSSLMYESINLDDTMYFTTGDISPTMYHSAACFYVNTDLAEDYNIECDYADLVNKGTWTWDVVGKLSKGLSRDLNNDNQWIYEDDFFGYIGNASNYLLTGCGVEYCSLTKDRKNIELDVVNDRTVAVMTKLQNVLDPRNPVEREFNNMINSAFKEDRAIFMTHLTESAGVHLRDMESDFLVLPVPKFDEAQETYRSAVNLWAHAFVGIPVTSANEFTGFITEALAAWSYENIRPLSWELTYKTKTIRDERSVQMLDIVFDNLYCTFANVYDFGGVATQLGNVLINEVGLASTIAAIQPSAEASIADMIEAWTKNKQ